MHAVARRGGRRGGSRGHTTRACARRASQRGTKGGKAGYDVPVIGVLSKALDALDEAHDEAAAGRQVRGLGLGALRGLAG